MYAPPKESVHITEIIQVLIGLGASVWSNDKMVEKWVDAGLGRMMDMALENKPENLDEKMRKWLSSSISKNQLALVSVLLDHGARISDPFSLLDLASSTEMVHLLCQNGADFNKVGRSSGQYPISKWVLGDLGSQKTQDFTGFQMAVSAVPELLKSGADLEAPGFQMVPFASAFLDPKKAAAYGRLCRGGFDAVPVSKKELASPLSAWAFRVFFEGEEPVSIRDSRKLIQACFENKKGLMDFEWFLAAAAIDHLEHRFNKHHTEAGAIISKRIEELRSLPSPSDPSRSRWDAACSDVLNASASFNSSWLDALKKKSFMQFVSCLAHGRPGIDRFGTIDEVNAHLNVAFDRVSNLSSVISRVGSWSVCIPDHFWEKQQYLWPEWMSKLDGSCAAHDLVRRFKSGKKIPSGIVRSPNWAPQLNAELDAIEIHEASEQVHHAHRPKRRTL